MAEELQQLRRLVAEQEKLEQREAKELELLREAAGPVRPAASPRSNRSATLRLQASRRPAPPPRPSPRATPAVADRYRDDVDGFREDGSEHRRRELAKEQRSQVVAIPMRSTDLTELKQAVDESLAQHKTTPGQSRVNRASELRRLHASRYKSRGRQKFKGAIRAAMATQRWGKVTPRYLEPTDGELAIQLRIVAPSLALCTHPTQPSRYT